MYVSRSLGRIDNAENLRKEERRLTAATKNRYRRRWMGQERTTGQDGGQRRKRRRTAGRGGGLVKTAVLREAVSVVSAAMTREIVLMANFYNLDSVQDTQDCC